jgi:hypothetical protein
MRDGSQFRRVVVCSGHMIDQYDRPVPRFPRHKEAIARRQIAEQLGDWGIGPGDLAICGGAQGADLLFAECCVALGAQVYLLIALPEEEFLNRSVCLEGANWEGRYFELAKKPNVFKFFQEDFLKDFSPELNEIDNVFARNNLWMLHTAIDAGGTGELFAILVWDEKETGDGPGGTSDFEQRIRQSHGTVAVINPTKL